jgi:hypothetical protein
MAEGRQTQGLFKADPGINQKQGKKMKKIICMEMLLIGASVLIFRSVWTFLDSIAWASSGVGLAVLLVAGVLLAVFALFNIQKPSGEEGDKREVG